MEDLKMILKTKKDVLKELRKISGYMITDSRADDRQAYSLLRKVVNALVKQDNPPVRPHWISNSRLHWSKGDDLKCFDGVVQEIESLEKEIEVGKTRGGKRMITEDKESLPLATALEQICQYNKRGEKL